MLTRRELLAGIASAPFIGALNPRPPAVRGLQVEIVVEPHSMSQESARGFQRLLATEARSMHARPSNLIILPGTRQLTSQNAVEMLNGAVAGRWLIMESGLCFLQKSAVTTQTRILRAVFDFEVGDPAPVSNSEPRAAYVQYTWPHSALVRDFSSITPVACSPAESIAQFEGVTVCAKRRIGKGGIILLGSMLGPGLFADEREAVEIGSAMLRFVEDQQSRFMQREVVES